MSFSCATSALAELTWWAWVTSSRAGRGLVHVNCTSNPAQPAALAALGRHWVILTSGTRGWPGGRAGRPPRAVQRQIADSAAFAFDPRLSVNTCGGMRCQNASEASFDFVGPAGRTAADSAPSGARPCIVLTRRYPLPRCTDEQGKWATQYRCPTTKRARPGQGGALKCAPVVPNDPLGHPRHPRHRNGPTGGAVQILGAEELRRPFCPPPSRRSFERGG